MIDTWFSRHVAESPPSDNGLVGNGGVDIALPAFLAFLSLLLFKTEKMVVDNSFRIFWPVRLVFCERGKKMSIFVEDVNSPICPTLNGRIGMQANMNAAKAFIAENNKDRSCSGGTLALAMFIEAIGYVQSAVAYDLSGYMGHSYSNKQLMNSCANICARVDNTHSNCSKAIIGALGAYALCG